MPNSVDSNYSTPTYRHSPVDLSSRILQPGIEYGSQAIAIAAGNPLQATPPPDIVIPYLKEKARYKTGFVVDMVRAQCNIPLILAAKEWLKGQYHHLKGEVYEKQHSARTKLALELWRAGAKADAYAVFMTPEPSVKHFYNGIHHAIDGNKHPIAAPLITGITAGAILQTNATLLSSYILGASATGCAPFIYTAALGAAAAPIIRTRLRDIRTTKEDIGARIINTITPKTTIEDCIEPFRLDSRSQKLVSVEAAFQAYQQEQNDHTYKQLIDAIYNNSPSLLSAHIGERWNKILHHAHDNSNR